VSSIRVAKSEQASQESERKAERQNLIIKILFQAARQR
jgi:hypothetical protein